MVFVLLAAKLSFILGFGIFVEVLLGPLGGGGVVGLWEGRDI